MADDLSIPSLCGGLNDTDPPHLLDEDQCTIAANVEFAYSSLGERRKGCETVDITGSGVESQAVITYLDSWFPANDVVYPEYLILGATRDVSVNMGRKTTAGVWTPVAISDTMVKTSPEIYGVNSQALNGKMFFSYASDQDRLHVLQNGVMRRSGLAQPVAAPTLADTGVGTVTSERFYRIRYIKKTGAVIDLRSEPSVSASIIPSGTGSGVRITRPALIGESETHWEVEASEADDNYYQIAEVAIGTTFYDDSTDLATTSFADLGDLSEDIGEYLLLPSAKFIAVDGDRLILGGHWTDDTKKCQVAWTLVHNDPGKGNDERLPQALDNTVLLDTTDGGEITALRQVANGTWYVFKWSRIYKLTRTGSPLRAYEVITLSKTNGAVPGSVTNGVDENGRSCLYFLDPFTGPSRLGAFGLQAILGIHTTWQRTNLAATIIARSLYYPDKMQIHWWVAVDGSDVPNSKIVVHTREMKSTGQGARRGIVLATGRSTTAYAVALWHETKLTEDGTLTLSGRPFMGLIAPYLLQRGDIQNTDAGDVYVARVRSKPLIVTGLLNKWGGMAAALLATPHATATVKVSLIRDFGLETNYVVTDLAPVASESYVIKFMDDLRLSEAKAIQVEFSDV